MRCLALADELRGRGAETHFVCAEAPDALRQRILESGHAFHAIERSAMPLRSGGDWHEPPLADADQRADAEGALAALGEAVDWMVVDHYLLDAVWHRSVRPNAAQVLVIDELANRELDCDLLADQALSPNEARWHVPPGTRILSGGAYAVLRPEFARERPAALARRREGRPAANVLVSLGTTDPGEITSSVVEDVLDAAPGCNVHVVLGHGAPSLGRMTKLAKQDRCVTLHVDARNMAVLMREADVAVGAAGTTSWERCCLGLPTVAVALAHNQQPTAAALQKIGAAVVADGPDGIGAALADLLANPERLQIMSAAAFGMTDGFGTSRIADAMLGASVSGLREEIHLRPAMHDDSEMLWLWRNDPVTRAVSREPAPIAWHDHARWFEASLAEARRHLWMAEHGGVPVGIVRFDESTDDSGTFEVSINVRPDARGGGIGRAILRAACAQFLERPGCSRIVAAISANNLASQRLFESCGFVRVADADAHGFARYALEIDAPLRQSQRGHR